MSKECVVCGNQVEWNKVRETFLHILDQADQYGVDSLTEHEQVVYLGLCCSGECYSNLQ